MKEEKKLQYELLCAQIESLITGETNEMGVLSNVSAVLHDAFPERFFWVGFYLVKDKELYLGPFQGSVACFHIKKGCGVCGTAWAKVQTIIVPDVEKFSGHIACSSQSRSEIVVPLLDNNGNVYGVIDIDSRELDAFDVTDRVYLEKIAEKITKILCSSK